MIFGINNTLIINSTIRKNGFIYPKLYGEAKWFIVVIHYSY
ncbi:hypothetical protein PAUR_b1046 [Pseudoalteromonas aurantia 208]|uniref:Uncharacterized protein n=1 Tax=Pseudoalteromonas aurantia 208 TaxID=1314867 RepID=A0ABR9EIV3_9GAMM|nr:hypothetical protein [Pseudoalteromonas aurantia 208]